MNRSKILTAVSLCLGVAASAAMSPAFAQDSSYSFCGLSNNRVSLLGLATSSNVIYTLSNGVVTVKQVTGVTGNLIGIDARPSDGLNGMVYGLSDDGSIYLISVSPNTSAARLVSRPSPALPGGFQALADFNPISPPNANAWRLIDSNANNYAAVNGANGGTLNTIAVQTSVTYAAGDLNAGAAPKLTAGAYTNNVTNAPLTEFLAYDFGTNSLVTIADRTANGSSNTGGGRLKTIGRITDQGGQQIDLSPLGGIDVYTRVGSGGALTNVILLSTGTDLYCVDPRSFDTTLPIGTRQTVRASKIATPSNTPVIIGGFADVAIYPPNG